MWREHDGERQVALVHRPRYHDWSLPKGKAEKGEHVLDTVVREISEECGASVSIGEHLYQVRYPISGVHHRPVQKTVDYWSLRYLGGRFRRGHETDQLLWLPINAARKKLSYPRDGHVLDEFEHRQIVTSLILLVRHAKAGKRSEWHEGDALRPLEPAGRAQARRLSIVLQRFTPDRIISANRVRCEQTVQVLARQLSQPITIAESFSDETYLKNPKETRAALTRLCEKGGVSVVCSQGVAIPGILQGFHDKGLVPKPGYGLRRSDFTTRKGSVWAIGFSDNQLVSLDYYAQP